MQLADDDDDLVCADSGFEIEKLVPLYRKSNIREFYQGQGWCLHLLLRICSAHLGMVRETRVSYRWCLLKQRYFCAVYNYAGKADLGRGYWYPRRKVGVAMHFQRSSI